MNEEQAETLELAREQCDQGECDLSAGELHLLVQLIDELADTLDEVIINEVPPFPCADLDRYIALARRVKGTRDTGEV